MRLFWFVLWTVYLSAWAAVGVVLYAKSGYTMPARIEWLAFWFVSLSMLCLCCNILDTIELRDNHARNTYNR